MWIVYDFETTSLSLLGQITQFCFIVYDEKWNEIDLLEGHVRLRPTEFPDFSAIQITHTSIRHLDQVGMSEFDAARAMYIFLNKQIQQFGHCILAGYNSSRFDLKYLRTTLIRNGLNPYFFGKLSSIDVLHYVHHIALNKPDTFPWTGSNSFWTFSLETIASSFGVLESKQSHAACDDVRLVVQLIKKLESTYREPIQEFRPVRLPHNANLESDLTIFKQKTIAPPPEKYIYTYYAPIFNTKSDIIAVNLSKFDPFPPNDEKELIQTLKYTNCNTQYMNAERLTESEQIKWAPIAQLAQEIAISIGFSRDRYFELIKQDRDIELQIHEMGFKRIKVLGDSINKTLANPHRFTEVTQELWSNRQTEKDAFLVQLFNRWGVNNLAELPPTFYDRYILPRYINPGRLLANELSIPEQVEAAIREKKKGGLTGIPEEYIEYARLFFDRFNLYRFYDFPELP